MKSFFTRYLPVILWMILIFSISSRTSLPTNGTYNEDFLTKKIAHIMEYVVLQFLMYRAVNQKSPNKAFLFSLIFAFSDEIHQLFVPTRTGKLRDVAIDSVGLILASLIITKFELWKKLLLAPVAKKPKQ